MTHIRLPIIVFIAAIFLGAGCARQERTTPPVSTNTPAQPAATTPAPQPSVPISITSPSSNDIVGNPIIANGLGIAFENTIQLRVKDANGKVLGKTNTIAYAPEYTAPGPWQATITYEQPTTETGTFEAYESSAKDGSDLHLVSVPILFPLQRMSSTNTNARVLLQTNMGKIEIDLFTADAPKTVENFLTLARKGFYNGTKFHRVIPQFMIQGGDPNSKDTNWATHGTGGPGYKFADEINGHKLVRGSLAMANAGPNTNGSQFFIVTAPETPWLDGKHTNFGRILTGMAVIDRIEAVQRNANDHPLEDVVIERIETLNSKP